jgi:hypothetical protein
MVKNMKHNIVILVILTAFVQSGLYGYHIITFFFRPYPHVYTPEQIAQKLVKPGKIAQLTIHKAQESLLVAGIFSTYSGYLTASDLDGQTIFPQQHEDPFIFIIVTQKISPIVMFGNTIHHWEFEEGTLVAMYSVEKMYAQETGEYLWNIEQVSVPENNRIPLESITIIAKPKNIYVPLGTTRTLPGPQVLLPDMYVKKGIMKAENALYILNLRNFFGVITPLLEKNKTQYRQIILF